MVLRIVFIPHSLANTFNPLSSYVVRQVVDARLGETDMDNRLNNKVLRTIYIPPKMDDKLTKMAKQMKKSRNDLIEQCIILGMRLKRD